MSTNPSLSHPKTKEQERQLRRAFSNRKSAKKSRQKKKEMLNSLSESYKKHCILNEQLRTEVQKLRLREMELEELLMAKNVTPSTNDFVKRETSNKPVIIPTESEHFFTTYDLDRLSTVLKSKEKFGAMTLNPSLTSVILDPLYSFHLMSERTKTKDQDVPSISKKIDDSLSGEDLNGNKYYSPVDKPIHLSASEEQVLLALLEDDADNSHNPAVYNHR